MQALCREHCLHVDTELLERYDLIYQLKGEDFLACRLSRLLGKRIIADCVVWFFVTKGRVIEVTCLYTDRAVQVGLERVRRFRPCQMLL